MDKLMIRKYKRQVAELEAENAKLWKINDELRKDGATQAQKLSYLQKCEENAELRKSAEQVQASVDAILREIINEYGFKGSIKIKKPNIGENAGNTIHAEYIGDTMFIQLNPEVKN